MALANGDRRAHLLPAVQKERTAVLSTVSLAELASLLQQGRLEETRMVEVIQGARREHALERDCLDGGRLHGQMRRRGHTKVSLVDCIVYATAQRLGAGLITLDSDLDGLSGVEVLPSPLKKA